MTKLKNNWRYKSLESLENQNWGDSLDAPTDLVKRCIELSKIPIDDFTASDLRLMIGQKFGLSFLVPLALEKLQDNIFIEADFYEGDLLKNLLDIDISFWKHNKSYWTQLNNLLNDQRKQLSEIKISTAKFDNANF